MFEQSESVFFLFCASILFGGHFASEKKGDHKRSESSPTCDGDRENDLSSMIGPSVRGCTRCNFKKEKPGNWSAKIKQQQQQQQQQQPGR